MTLPLPAAGRARPAARVVQFAVSLPDYPIAKANVETDHSKGGSLPLSHARRGCKERATSRTLASPGRGPRALTPQVA
jgi:hypothetical protein